MRGSNVQSKAFILFYVMQLRCSARSQGNTVIATMQIYPQRINFLHNIHDTTLHCTVLIYKTYHVGVLIYRTYHVGSQHLEVRWFPILKANEKEKDRKEW